MLLIDTGPAYFCRPRPVAGRSTSEVGVLSLSTRSGICTSERCARTTHALFQLLRGHCRRENIDCNCAQLRSTLCHPLCELEDLVIWRYWRDPWSIEISIMLHTCNMNFNHPLQRKICHIQLRVEAAIVSREPYVRNIDQESAVRLLKEARQELRFRHLRTEHRKETGNVFHHQRRIHRIAKPERVFAEALQ